MQVRKRKRSVSDKKLEAMATWMVDTKSTIRATAKHFGVKKATLHRRFRERLPEINSDLASEVFGLFEENFREAHIRGGKTTALRYSKTA